MRRYWAATTTRVLWRWQALVAPQERERGDVPGWVLITVMTAGLVTALWVVADGALRSMLTTALRGVTKP